MLVHGLINYTDTKAKCRHLKKKFTCKGTLQQVTYLSDIPPPHVTNYIRTCTYSQGRRGEFNQREGLEAQQFTKLG
jgi:hypothetical protein